jgi:diphthine synthase
VILENANLYIQDAEKFLEDGQDEVAILSIGYADGLVDALRLAKGLDPKM